MPYTVARPRPVPLPSSFSGVERLEDMQHMLGRNPHSRVGDRQQNPIIIDVDPIAAGRRNHRRSHMVGIDRIPVVMIVVMQQNLPLIEQLAVTRLGVTYRRRQIDRRCGAR